MKKSAQSSQKCSKKSAHHLTIRKLKTLLGIIAASVPFKPNMQGIARDLGMSRNDISDLFYYLEKAGMIAQLRQSTEGIALLGKVDKVYLNNTNLMYLLASDKIEIGNVRETFFLSATQVTEHVLASTISDFQIGEYTFEVGGKKKRNNCPRPLAALSYATISNTILPI